MHTGHYIVDQNREWRRKGRGKRDLRVSSYESTIHPLRPGGTYVHKVIPLLYLLLQTSPSKSRIPSVARPIPVHRHPLLQPQSVAVVVVVMTRLSPNPSLEVVLHPRPRRVQPQVNVSPNHFLSRSSIPACERTLRVLCPSLLHVQLVLYGLTM